MERVKIEVSLRERIGKEGTKKVRQEGCVPAVIYGHDTNLSVKVTVAGMKALRSVHFAESAIIDVDVVGGKKKDSFSVLIKHLQQHPINEEVLHIDFLRVALDEKITVPIPVVLKGEPEALKEDGVLDQVLWEIEIEALPLDIPEKVEVDISELTIGHSIHASDIKLPSKVVLITSPEETVATMKLKKEEEIPEEVPAEGEEAAVEPEVIKEKKEGEAEEAAPEEGKGKEDKKE